MMLGARFASSVSLAGPAPPMEKAHEALRTCQTLIRKGPNPSTTFERCTPREGSGPSTWRT